MDIRKQLVFLKNLNKAYKSGLRLDGFFDRLAKKAVFPHERSVYQQMSKDIQNGSTISAALSKHPDFIENLYINLIRVGEKSGKLDSVLADIIRSIEKLLDLKNQIYREAKGTIFRIFGTLFTFFIILFWLIPAINNFFDEFTCKTPALVGFFRFMAGSQFMLLIAFFAVIGLFVLDFQNSGDEDVYGYLSRKLVKMPFVGSAIRWFNLYYYFLTLKLCYSAGLSFVESAELASSTVMNRHLKAITDEISRKTREGESISSALTEFEGTKLFEPEILELVETGEETGRLEESLNDVNYLLNEYIMSFVNVACRAVDFAAFVFSLAPVAFIVLSVLDFVTNSADLIKNIKLD